MDATLAEQSAPDPWLSGLRESFTYASTLVGAHGHEAVTSELDGLVGNVASGLSGYRWVIDMELCPVCCNIAAFVRN